MKPKSKLSIFALQQRLSRPGITVVFTVFTLVYLLYLIAMLVINSQYYDLFRWAKNPFDGFSEASINFITYNDIRTTNIETIYLIRSEVIFLCSLAVIVLILTLAHVKMNKGADTIKRLTISNRSVRIMQWLSDCAYTLGIWLSHIVVIFLFCAIYMIFYPHEQMDPHKFYAFFASERYLYMLFPVLNPLSLIRMLSLVLAISFLPSLISGIIDNIMEEDFYFRDLFGPILLIGLICWSYFESAHEWSLIVCVIAMIVGAFCYRAYLLKWEDINAAKSS